MIITNSCARMGNPDGGWYDEQPPYVVGAAPADRGTEVKQSKVTIFFNEFIKIDNATEKVVVSPPQMEMPEIKAHGRRITVELKDSLKPNTTYTVDFSDAITDNNEQNPLGNYTYSFSTGTEIDTMEVSGTVLNAEDLEPVKGILVGLYPESYDSILHITSADDSIPPFLRVARTGSDGRFVIRGIKPGRYYAQALQDVDGDYRFSQRGETMAFSWDVIETGVYPDIRQDTIFRPDGIHIHDILLTPYQHYTPDNITLLAFAHPTTDRYFLKAERIDPEKFTLYFTAPVLPEAMAKDTLASQDSLSLPTDHAPATSPLSGESEGASLLTLVGRPDVQFHIESSAKGDTVTYWLPDTALVNQDTLQIVLTTYLTDTLGVQRLTTDTTEILAKTPYERRLKQQQKEAEEWQKSLEKKRKRLREGEVLTDTIMPPKYLEPDYKVGNSIAPDATLRITFPAPMASVDTSAVHLYVEQDSLWYRAPFRFEPDSVAATLTNDSLPRQWVLYSDWLPGAHYSLEVDTLAFTDIYGHTSKPYQTGIRIQKLEDFSSLFVNITGLKEEFLTPHPSPLTATATAPATSPPSGESEGASLLTEIVVQLIDASGKVQRTATTTPGSPAEFYYVKPGKYYMRAFIDRNGNGTWDTGDYYRDLQPEQVFYYHEELELKAKWDITKQWNLSERPIAQQKPAAITKQKAEKKKTIQGRNLKRAQDKGIPLPDYLR